MIQETINKLIDPKYTLRLCATQIYDTYHQGIYLGVIIHKDDHTKITIHTTTNHIIHTISYNDPNYQTKINQILAQAVIIWEKILSNLPIE